MYQNQPDPKWLQQKSSKELQIKEAKAGSRSKS
jgi:hypothetical protein